MFKIFSALNIPTTLYLSISNKNYMTWGCIHIAFYFSGLFSNYIFNYFVLRHREDLQVKQTTLWIYPLFTAWIALARAFGFMGGILYYIPFKAAKDSWWNITPRGICMLRNLSPNISPMNNR